MDSSAADSLLALSNTAVALAEAEDPDDDGRSSSLSELDDEEAENMDSDPVEPTTGLDGDSEAETERLEESPDKIAHRKPFGISPSKLAQTAHVDERPEIESLTDSAMSSPISSREASPEEEGLSEGEGNDEDTTHDHFERKSPSKRKREIEEQDEEDAGRSRRRRTGSVPSDDNKSDESDAEDGQSQRSREATVEPDGEIDGPEDGLEEEEDQDDAEKLDSSEDSKGKTRDSSTRIPRRRGNENVPADADPEVEDEPDAGEESEEVDADDTEAAAKSEEEQAKRLAAMEALTALERHFATLRDRLYDERIAAINQELAQLAEGKPSHPEFLRQLDAVQKYRDDKFEIEQKLLVYKTGALKNKSVAERSQIHSAYFQTVRDIREKHLERISEHFYRIQRDRFKSESAVPTFTIPFPQRRSQQIIQQTAYNKEVSILSGIAKWVGFPAAPELSQSHTKELDEDMQKMGISPTQVRTTRPAQKTAASGAFNTTLSGPAAEEQFLEQTPWANPQHPIHRLGVSRQNSDRSLVNDTFLTPANQQRISDNLQPGGSASTIAEQPSIPASSALNTPHDAMTSQTKVEPQGTGGGSQNYRVQSTSPLETRRANSAAVQQNHVRPTSQPQELRHETDSSPLASRINLAKSPPRASSAAPDKVPRHSTASPFGSGQTNENKDTFIPTAATAGFTGAGRMSLL